MKQTVIVSARRSPIGKFLGSLSRLPAPEFGAQVARAVLEESGVDKNAVDEVIIGNVLQAGLGQNPARQVALKAGLPDTITAWTVNKVCGSSLEAVYQADRAIRAGDIRIALAGGIESMSRAPYYLDHMRAGHKFGNSHVLDGMYTDGLSCPFEKWAMGAAADHTARDKHISRADQDRYALQSHQRAAAAAQAGRFKQPIVPIDIGHGKMFDADETIRADATLDGMAKLAPAFDKDGTVTAGNASQISDGAAMLLVCDAETAKARGWTVRAEVISFATSGTPPRDLFLAPIDAIRNAVDRAGMQLSAVDLVELNEAFASQMLACIRGLELDVAKVNVNGGAIALGHPIGASGARILVTLIHALEQRNLKTGVASACLGGGNAVAMVIRRP